MSRSYLASRVDEHSHHPPHQTVLKKQLALLPDVPFLWNTWISNKPVHLRSSVNLSDSGFHNLHDPRRGGDLAATTTAAQTAAAQLGLPPERRVGGPAVVGGWGGLGAGRTATKWRKPVSVDFP